jgi:hypothetical protein
LSFDAANQANLDVASLPAGLAHALRGPSVPLNVSAKASTDATSVFQGQQAVVDATSSIHIVCLMITKKTKTPVTGASVQISITSFFTSLTTVREAHVRYALVDTATALSAH